MVAESGSFSPSAGKPRLAVESWQARGVPLDIRSFDPVTRAQIKRAHNPVFVDDLLDCWIENGFGNHRADVATSLPYTSGSMLAAAQEALRNGVGAVSPTSGFHHAGYAHAAGFCSLNGLMVTAMNLPDLHVGILDFDMHYGDGTNDIIVQLDQHQRVIHYSQGAQRRVSGGAFLYSIPGILQRFEGCDVLLYQSGADPAIGDPLGNWLTVEQLAKRDALVFSGLRRMGVPVAWNLAGGYQSPFEAVLHIHNNTMLSAAKFWLS
jgi:acetoin utilization deacetylase AcuC-like enzyme